MPRRRGVALHRAEALKQEQPEVYDSLKTLETAVNDLTATVNAAAPPAKRPTGPRTATVSQLGGKLRIEWEGDTSTEIEAYRIVRATAGTRSSPSTPLFTDGTQRKILPAQNVCQNRGGINEWVDADFEIAEFKTDNPTRFSYWVEAIGKNGLFSAPIIASGSPVELLTAGQGELSPNPKFTSPNKLFNASFITSVTTVDVNVPKMLTVAAVNNATPIEIRTSANHGLSTGNRVYVNRSDNTNANGFWTVTVVDADQFTLDGSGGGSAGTAGFVVLATPGQPTAPSFEGAEDSDGSPSWTAWFDLSTDATAVCQFASSGAVRTGEVEMQPPTGTANTSLAQEISISKFTGGEAYTFSVAARLAPGTSPGTGTTFALVITDPSAATIGTLLVDGSVLTTSYQRFFATIVFGDISGYDDFDKCSVQIKNNRTSSGANTIYLRWPMLNPGHFPGLWTDTLDQGQGVGTYSSAPEASNVPDYDRGQFGYGQIDATYA